MSDNIIPRVELLEDGRPADPDRLRRFIDLVRLGLNPLVNPPTPTGGAGEDPWDVATLQPPFTDFTISLNFGIRGSVANEASAVYFQDVGPAIPGDNFMARVKTIAATPWTITIAFQLMAIPGVSSFGGLIFRDSGTGRFTALLLTTRPFPNPYEVDLVQFSGFTASVTTLANQIWTSRRDVCMFRIVNDGTHITHYVSLDFQHWLPFFQELVAGNYVANINQIGYTLSWNSGSPPTGTTLTDTQTAMLVYHCKAE